MPADTHVDILLYEGFDELDAIGPFEVIRTANAIDDSSSVDARLVTLEATDAVTASHGLTVEPDGVLGSPTGRPPGEPDVVLIPGGGWSDRRTAGAWAEVRDGTIPDRLDTLHEEGVRLASVCTGALLLAAAGLLDGRPASTHYSARDDLAAYGANVSTDRVVDDGDILTAGGVTSGIDLAVHLVEECCGPAVAEQVATELEWERRD